MAKKRTIRTAADEVATRGDVIDLGAATAKEIGALVRELADLEVETKTQVGKLYEWIGKLQYRVTELERRRSWFRRMWEIWVR